MLFVDLDKSLLKTDYIYECFINFLSKDLGAPFKCAYIFLKHGKIGLKKFLYQKANLSINKLPYNLSVLEFIKDWKNKNPDKKVFLISASYFKVIEEIAIHLKIFDGWEGTKNINLKSFNKLNKIKELTKEEKFTYLGDSYDDIPIWKNADCCILVNPSQNLINKVKKFNKTTQIIENKKINILKETFKSLRLHQWIKNILLFVPAILTFKQSLIFFISDLMIGFIAFSLIASAFYVMNDLFDIENDRNHHSKNKRCFASGTLSIKYGFLIFTFLCTTGIFLALNLTQYFQQLLILYAISSFFYSMYLKKIRILDIFTLSYLYILRILAGSAITDTFISNWLLTFSAFFFLFLAAVKRWIELKRVSFNSMPGRGYKQQDLSFISKLSYFTGIISVLVICLYIESQQALILFESKKIVWLIPVILLYWILETLLKAERNEIDDDPVKYALKSKTSYYSLLGFIIILLIATQG